MTRAARPARAAARRRAVLVTLMAIAKTVTMARDRIVGPGSGGVEEERFNYALRPLKFHEPYFPNISLSSGSIASAQIL